MLLPLYRLEQLQLLQLNPEPLRFSNPVVRAPFSARRQVMIRSCSLGGEAIGGDRLMRTVGIWVGVSPMMSGMGV